MERKSLAAALQLLLPDPSSTPSLSVTLSRSLNISLLFLQRGFYTSLHNLAISPFENKLFLEVDLQKKN